MKLEDRVKLYGGLLITPKCQEPLYFPNVVCAIGKQMLASHAANNASSNYWFSHLVTGSGILAASTEDLAMVDEFYRVALNVFATNYTVFGSVTITGLLIDDYSGVAPGAGSYDISEWGLIDALTNGNLICRQVPDYVFTITGDEALDVLWGVVMT